MNTTFAGHWFSGRDLGTHPVLVAIEGDTLRVSGIEPPREAPLAVVRVSDRLGGTPRFLHFPDGSSIETTANDAIDGVLAARGRRRSAAIIHGLEQRSRVAAAATVLFIASVTALVFYALPRLSRAAAYAVPEALERRAGEAGLATLQRILRPSQLDRRGQERVAGQLQRLVRAGRFATSPRLEFRSMGNFPNAFALPGGIIIMSDQLVALATNDELAAVLAHEIAHWQLRHGLQGVFRNSAALLIVTTVTGDLSTLTTFAATIPLVLLQRGYSREFEAEADRRAVELLRQARVDPRHLATILAKLERSRPATGQDFSYLSTHPATGDRIRAIDPAGAFPEPPAGAPAESARTDNVMPEPVRKERANIVLPPRVDTMPVVREQPAPDYPLLMRAQGRDGEVIVSFIVDERGDVRAPYAVKSTSPHFAVAAVAAVSRWKFEPARLKGKKVAHEMRVPIVFNLSEETASPAPPQP